MNVKRKDDDGLEELLKTALADDLPIDVAAGMKDRFDRFRGRGTRPERRRLIPAVLLRRSAWAALSVLTLVTGSLLQAVGSRSALADRISAIGTSQSVSRRLAEADTMLCTARVSRSQEGPLDLFIEWRRGLGTTATVRSHEGTILGTIGPEHPGLDSDPGLRDLAPLLNPAGVAELIAGGWRVSGFTRKGDCDIGTYEAERPDGSAVLEITIDLCSHLPVLLRSLEIPSSGPTGAGAAVWEARFDFSGKGATS